MCVLCWGWGKSLRIPRIKRLSYLTQIEGMSLENSEPLSVLWIHTQRKARSLPEILSLVKLHPFSFV